MRTASVPDPRGLSFAWSTRGRPIMRALGQRDVESRAHGDGERI